MPPTGLIASAESVRISLLPRLRGHAMPPRSGRISRKREQSQHRLVLVIPLTMTLAIMLSWGAAAFAGSCGSVTACQIQQQETLLAPFNALLGTPAGQAVLTANLQTINAIYLNSTQAQKIASGTVLIQQAIPANLLLRAFPGNPNFGYDFSGPAECPTHPRFGQCRGDRHLRQHPTGRPEDGLRGGERLSTCLWPVARAERLARQSAAVPSVRCDPQQSIHRRELVAARRAKPADAGRVRHKLARPGRLDDRRFPQRSHADQHDHLADLCRPGARLLSATRPGGG